MKSFLIATSLLLSAGSSCFAYTATDLNTNWVCTTNASSSSKNTDKAADDLMKKQAGSAMNAFSYAAKNCRDCTKIYCKSQH